MKPERFAALFLEETLTKMQDNSEPGKFKSEIPGVYVIAERVLGKDFDEERAKSFIEVWRRGYDFGQSIQTDREDRIRRAESVLSSYVS